MSNIVTEMVIVPHISVEFMCFKNLNSFLTHEPLVTPIFADSYNETRLRFQKVLVYLCPCEEEHPSNNKIS